jgi:hypothetical protein
MTISRDLYLAIRSMDSYNRGYGEGVLGIPVTVHSIVYREFRGHNTD